MSFYRNTVGIFMKKHTDHAIKINHISKVLLLLMATLSLTGCEFLLFDPKGPIASQQKDLIIFSFVVMLFVVIPTIIIAVVFGVKYRASNTDNDYQPEWAHSNKVEFVVWSIPIVIIIILGIITYKTSFSLDPRQPIASEKQTMRVHVVALDWKWLFIYPEQEVASVNELAIPVNQPVEFLITSDTVMNAFFVPQLGSMIYAMAGMENQLHLIAEQEGVYRGMSANYSGFGFSGMKFKAHALNASDFNQWVTDVKSAQQTLTDARYDQLKEKSKDHPVEYFSYVNPLKFNRIIENYTGVQNGE